MAVSISLLLNSDTDGYGFDQHTDEELRKIVEEAARAAQADTEVAKYTQLSSSALS